MFDEAAAEAVVAEAVEEGISQGPGLQCDVDKEKEETEEEKGEVNGGHSLLHNGIVAKEAERLTTSAKEYSVFCSNFIDTVRD